MVIGLEEGRGHLERHVWGEHEAGVQVALTAQTEHDLVEGEEWILVEHPLVGQCTHAKNALMTGHRSVGWRHDSSIVRALDAARIRNPRGTIVTMCLELDELRADLGRGNGPVRGRAERLLVDLVRHRAHSRHH